MAPWQTIIAEKRPERIGLLTLNRPELRNAISIQMRRDICGCLNEWKEDPEIGVLVITGAGPDFTAGFDLTEFKKPDLFGELFASSSRYHRDIWRSNSGCPRFTHRCAGSSGREWPGIFA